MMLARHAQVIVEQQGLCNATNKAQRFIHTLSCRATACSSCTAPASSSSGLCHLQWVAAACCCCCLLAVYFGSLSTRHGSCLFWGTALLPRVALACKPQ